jgi:hypothetical protein
MGLMLRSSSKRSPDQRHHDRAVFEWASSTLEGGGRLTPVSIPDRADEE